MAKQENVECSDFLRNNKVSVVTGKIHPCRDKMNISCALIVKLKKYYEQFLVSNVIFTNTTHK